MQREQIDGLDFVNANYEEYDQLRLLWFALGGTIRWADRNEVVALFELDGSVIFRTRVA